MKQKKRQRTVPCLINFDGKRVCLRLFFRDGHRPKKVDNPEKISDNVCMQFPEAGTRITKSDRQVGSGMPVTYSGRTVC